MVDINGFSPIDQVLGVGQQLAGKLSRLGIDTVNDLIEWLPFRFEDQSQHYKIKQLPTDEDCVIEGTISGLSSRRSKRGVLMIQARIEDESGKITAFWFNQRYLLSYLKVGQTILLFGQKRIIPTLGNPFFVKKIIDQLAVVPIYPTTQGLSQIRLRNLIHSLKPLIAKLPDIIPQKDRQKLDLPSRSQALLDCHFSPTEESLAEATRLLAGQELLLLSLRVLLAKKSRQAQSAIKPLVVKQQTLNEIRSRLPFVLTTGQEQAITEIIRDLIGTSPMFRLLYGEVGSGKTAVALLATAIIIQAGRQVAWLAPTTILAEQHYQLLTAFFDDHVVAKITGTQKDDLTKADIVIGTHALLNQVKKLTSLGLVVVDEQQRFGVAQRHILQKHFPSVHILLMSATPIPRSLAQTLFGYLDITVMEGKPAHQKPVKTIVFDEDSRNKVEAAITRLIAQGQPGYVICPFINAPDIDSGLLFPLNQKAVLEEEKRLKSEFPRARIARVHGQMKAQERLTILDQFRSNKFDILLATSLVEVGIDNPQASWMMIEQADNFGLSQLHQLRGRIGRGDRQSYCFLSSNSRSVKANQRLKVLTSTANGLEIAEEDLRLRGSGQMIGSKQSGDDGLQKASLANLETIRAVFAVSQGILDDGLNKHPAILEALKAKQKEDEYLATA